MQTTTKTKTGMRKLATERVGSAVLFQALTLWKRRTGKKLTGWDETKILRSWRSRLMR